MKPTKRNATDEEIFALWDRIGDALGISVRTGSIEFGRALWRVFSNNNEVSSDTLIYNAGSFRGTAGLIALWSNKRIRSSRRWDYLHFYCATSNPFVNKILLWLRQKDFKVEQLAKGWDAEV